MTVCSCLSWMAGERWNGYPLGARGIETRDTRRTPHVA